MRNSLVGLVTLMVLGAQPGCGDNSRACGPGTVEELGACIPAATCGFGTRPDDATGECVPDGTIVCADGTVFDPLTSMCKIDPAACQNGTVLIGGACVDPTAGLIVDVEEGPEPNGLGIIEASQAQAGNITIKPGGEPFVIHGTFHPHRDANQDGSLDPDVDTYVLDIGAPTFLRISADGVGGAAGGFVVVAAPVDDAGDPLADWQRAGLSVIGDTAVREVYLPRAARYHVAIADTRTLVEYVTTNTATAAPGGNTSEYYVSLTAVPAPMPEDLTIADGGATVTTPKPSGRIVAYRAPLGSGLNQITLAMPSPLVASALVITSDGELASLADEGSGPARAVIGDVGDGDETVLYVDHLYSLVPGPVTYTLDVRATDAVALSTTGGTVMATATTNHGNELFRLNMFSFDVAAAETSLGMFVAFDIPVTGQIYDARGQRAAAFTAPTSGATWTQYRGIVRLREPGRYYLAVFAPSASSATTIAVTSTIVPLTPTAVTKDTPLVAAPISSLRVSPFIYDADTDADPWQQFDAIGTNTGGHSVAWFDPEVAYGRLDPLATSIGTLAGQVTPIFSRTYAQGGGAIGRVLLSDPTERYYVKVSALAPGANPTVTLAFGRRTAMTDLGTIASGTGVTRSGEMIDPATPARYYLFRTQIGNTAMITVTPAANLNTQFRRLRADETGLGNVINTNGPDVETFVQSATDWTAFVVSAAGNLPGARTFDVSVFVQ